MKLKDLQKGEFWIATLLYLFAIVVLVSNTSNREHDGTYYLFREVGVTFSYLSSYLIPRAFEYSLLYFSFLLLNFCLLPSLLKKDNQLLHYFIITTLIIVVGLITSICNTYSEAYLLVRYDTLQQAYNRIFFDGFSYAVWMVILISAYVLIKEFIIYLFNNRDRQNMGEDQIKVDVSIGLAFWFVGLLLLLTTRAQIQSMAVWSLVIFSAIGTIVYSIHYLLPSLFLRSPKFKIYFKQVFYLALLLAVPMSLISAIVFFGRAEEFLSPF